MSLTAHLLIRITLVGLLCWLGVAAGVVWQLQHEGEHDITAQADRLQALTEEQLRRQLIAVDAGGRTPDLARVVAVFGRAVCLSYQAIDVSEPVRWGCDADTAHPERDPMRAPAWLDEWLSRSGALPRSVTRTIRLWSRHDGTLTITPHRATLIEALWQRLRDLSGLTAATIIAVNLLVLLALRRLLRPTTEVLRRPGASRPGRTGLGRGAAWPARVPPHPVEGIDASAHPAQAIDRPSAANSPPA